MQRLSRLRKTASSRALIRETSLSVNNFIAPLFISETLEQKEEVKSMPGVYQLPLDAVVQEVESLWNLGIKAILLFGIPAKKDASGSEAFNDDGIVQKAIRTIRATNKEILIISDICFCEYTDHGHCGVLKDAAIDTAETLKLLKKQALSHAKAGASWLAPSGMTDGMVNAMREALDAGGFTEIPILSYAVKYCSALYGPFREAALGAPAFGDRKAYQMDPANAKEALREAMLDIEEGADMLMVKPAGFYLDIIASLKQHFPEVPLCAYQVSGEYSMIKAAHSLGYLPEEAMMLESLIAIKRAGADFIISYFAKEIALFLNKNKV